MTNSNQNNSFDKPVNPSVEVTEKPLVVKPVENPPSPTPAPSPVSPPPVQTYTPPPQNLPPSPPPPPPVSQGIKVQKSPFRFLIPGLAAGIIILLIILGIKKWSESRQSAAGPSENEPGQITNITYWGLWEPSIIMREVLQKFEDQNPDI